MPPIIIDSCEQRSDAWISLRLGNPGASSADNIITPTGLISKQRDVYLWKLTEETFMGRCDEGFKSKAMMQGAEREAEARALFELVMDIEVRQVSLVYKDEWKLFHASPDGLVGEDVGLEIKCPIFRNHVQTLDDRKLPSDKFCQVQMNLYTTERDLWYFLSYYPGLPPCILEIRRDEAFIAKLETALYEFCEDLRKLVERLKALK